MNVFCCRLLQFSLLALIYNPFILAADWQIEEGLLNPAALDKLKSKHKTIANADDLTQLLRDMNASQSFSSLYAVYEHDQWLIRGKKAKLIRNFEFKTLTRLFLSNYESVTLKYIGQVDSEEIRNKIEIDLKQFLESRGYPKASLEFYREFHRDEVTYLIKIDTDYPCTISEINFGFTLPKGIDFDLSIGNECNIEQTQEALEQLERDLLEAGYSQLRLLEPYFDYNASKDQAKLIINGSLGRKVNFVIVDTEKQERIFSLDFFTDGIASKYDPAIVGPEAMNNEIASRYKNKGYLDIIVSESEIEYPSANEIEYVYKVTPQTQYFLTNIRFEGIRVFSDEDLEEIFNISNFWQTATPINFEEIEKGIESLKAKYLALGYWDIKIREPRVTKNKQLGTVQLVIVVSEGSQRKVKGIEINGNTTISNKEILRFLRMKVNQPINRNELVDFDQKLRETYIKKGFLYSSVQIELVEERNQRNIPTTIRVKIQEGTPAKIGEIKIVGLIHTKPYVVTREIRFKTGDDYNVEKIEQTRRALINLGMFRSVQIGPADQNAINDQAQILDILIEVRESKAGNISFGPGWSYYRGSRFAIESSYNNIAGTGRQVFGRGALSEEKNQEAISSKTLVGRTVSAGYLEPHIFDLPINGTISASNHARADETWVISSAGELAFSHRLRKFLEGSTVTGFYGQKLNRELAREAVVNALGATDVRIGRTGVRYTLDLRNETAWPTKGFILESEVSWALYPLGGDLQYFYWKVNNNHYFQIIRNWVIAFGISFAAFEGVHRKSDIHEDTLPPSERLWTGGADTIRGFRERDLGPYVLYGSSGQEQRPFGGTNSAVFKVELRYQMVADTFAISTFSDAGNNWFSERELRKVQQINCEQNVEPDLSCREIVDNEPYLMEDMIGPETFWSKNYHSFGFALNYLTPLGSLNLAYGLPINRCIGGSEDCKVKRGSDREPYLLSGEVHFNVGANF